ncbi:MAG: ATP-binding cassette domain-containing protein [Calditrichaeota bacterium]|nr:MAG: ATP-binding cassette domain-containing protein [Calditrichota bacterium]
MISIQNVTKSYGASKAVNNISLEIEKGEILGFLGPNGAGKTTMMKMITCFFPPTEGTIEVDGFNVFDQSFQVRELIGYLPEHNPLYLEMNVVDYLKFVADIRKISDKSGRIREIIELCGIGEMKSKLIGQLSKGYRQRVGLAQALIHNPPILILDEPTTGLDPNQIVEIRNLIKQLGQDKTVIFSTHILSEVKAIANRVTIINRGEIVADGSSEDLQNQASGTTKINLEIKVGGTNSVAEKLSAINGVSNVKTLNQSNENYEIQLDATGGSDPREEIFNLAVSNDWKLLEIHRDRMDLEDIFRSLTQ